MARTKKEEVASLETDVMEDDLESLVPRREKWVYYLKEKNPNLENTFDMRTRKMIDTPDYPPLVTVPIVSSIYWPGGNDPFGTKRNRGKHLVRYYSGCTNLFIDQQPKEKDILDSLLSNEANEISFRNGRFEILGHDTMKILFMNWASWNEDSPYKTPGTKSIYKNFDAQKEKTAQRNALKSKREAMRLAESADEDQLIFHAKFLGIPFEDFDTGERDLELIRTDYEQAAFDDPDRFIRTYKDKKLKVKFFIEKAVNSGQIVANAIRGQATWADTRQVICPVPEGVMGSTLIECLSAFSEKQEAEDFCEQLKIKNS